MVGASILSIPKGLLTASGYEGICGLAGFPLDGLHESLRNSMSKSKLKEIIRSRITQGIEEMCAATNEERQLIINKWHELRQ